MSNIAEGDQPNHLDNIINGDMVNHSSNPQKTEIEVLGNDSSKVSNGFLQNNESSNIIKHVVIAEDSSIINTIPNLNKETRTIDETNSKSVYDFISPNTSIIIDKSKSDDTIELILADEKLHNDKINIKEVNNTKEEKVIEEKKDDENSKEEKVVKDEKYDENSKKEKVIENKKDDENFKKEKIVQNKKDDENSKQEIKSIKPVTKNNISIQKSQDLNGPEYYIKQAKGLKDKAKPYFESKKFNEAISVYEYALRLIGPQHISIDDKEYKEAISLQNSLLLNLSLCYSNLNNHAASLKLAQEVLKADQLNTKAIFRVAVEYKELGYLYRSFLLISDCRLLMKKLELNEQTDPGIEREYKFLEEIVKPFLVESSDLRRKISMKILGIKDVPVLESKSADFKEIKPFENQKKGKFSRLKYGICVVSASILGSFMTKYFLKYGLQREYSVGMGALSTLAFFFSFISENKWLKAIVGSSPLILASLFYGIKRETK